MRGEYRVEYEEGEHNWSAYSPDLPGCVSTGKTRADVERNMQEAIRGHLETIRLYGDGPIGEAAAAALREKAATGRKKATQTR